MTVTVNDLQTRIVLETVAAAPTADGGLADTYATLAEAWAKVEAIAGGRYIADRQQQDVATHRVTIRHRADWRTVATIKVGSSRLRVRSARVLDQRKTWVEFLAEEERTDA